MAAASFEDLLQRADMQLQQHRVLAARTDLSLYRSLEFAYRIAIQLARSPDAIATFANHSYWRDDRFDHAKPFLNAVKFMLRPLSTSDRKKVSRTASALEYFVGEQVEPDSLIDSIQATPGGIAGAARTAQGTRRAQTSAEKAAGFTSHREIPLMATDEFVERLGRLREDGSQRIDAVLGFMEGKLTLQELPAVLHASVS